MSDKSSDETFEFDVFARKCASRETLQDITGRWGVLALAALHEGPYRFGALRRRVDGVSERMLAQTLQTLERDGLVNRTVLEAIPPRVEYSLTDVGAAIAGQLVAFIDVVEAHMPQIEAARARGAT